MIRYGFFIKPDFPNRRGTGIGLTVIYADVFKDLWSSAVYAECPNDKISLCRLSSFE